MVFTPSRVPVLRWAWLAAALSVRRFLTEPSTPRIGSDASNSALSGWAAACCSSCARCAALMRSLRDRPAPFSSASSGKSSRCIFSQSCTARVLRSRLVDATLSPSPSLMELLAIRLGCPETSAKSLVTCEGEGREVAAPSDAVALLPLQRAAEFLPQGAEHRLHVTRMRHHAEVMFALAAFAGIAALQHDAVAARLHEDAVVPIGTIVFRCGGGGLWREPVVQPHAFERRLADDLHAVAFGQVA